MTHAIALIVICIGIAIKTTYDDYRKEKEFCKLVKQGMPVEIAEELTK